MDGRGPVGSSTLWEEEQEEEAEEEAEQARKRITKRDENAGGRHEKRLKLVPPRFASIRAIRLRSSARSEEFKFPRRFSFKLNFSFFFFSFNPPIFKVGRARGTSRAKLEIFFSKKDDRFCGRVSAHSCWWWSNFSVV